MCVRCLNRRAVHAKNACHPIFLPDDRCTSEARSHLSGGARPPSSELLLPPPSLSSLEEVVVLLGSSTSLLLPEVSGKLPSMAKALLPDGLLPPGGSRVPFIGDVMPSAGPAVPPW